MSTRKGNPIAVDVKGLVKQATVVEAKVKDHMSHCHKDHLHGHITVLDGFVLGAVVGVVVGFFIGVFV